MNKLWKPALLSIAVIIMAIGMINSGAWWTDSATNQTASISSGTLTLDKPGIQNVSLGTITNMAPGDLTDEVEIIIKNDGTIPLAWFGDLVVGSSILKDVIYIETARMEFLSPVGEPNWEPTDQFITAGKGSGDYPTTWGGPENYATLAAYDGNQNMNATGYEHMGALMPGYAYKLTLKFGFYPGAGNGYQAAGPLDISFKVNAYQTSQAALDAVTLGGQSLGTHFAWMQQQLAKQ